MKVVVNFHQMSKLTIRKANVLVIDKYSPTLTLRHHSKNYFSPRIPSGSQTGILLSVRKCRFEVVRIFSSLKQLEIITDTLLKWKITRVTNVAAEWLANLLLVGEVLDSDFSPETGY